MIKDLDPNKTYNLSAFIYVDRFFYGLFDDQQLEYKSNFSFKDLLDLKRQISKSNITKVKVNKAAIISSIAPAGLIEYDDFSFNTYKSFFRGHFPEEFLSVSNYHAQKLKEQKLYAAFAFPREIEKLLKTYAAEVEFVHISKVLADYLTKQKSDVFLILINDQYCSMVYNKDKTTSFANTFRLTGELDSIYYTRKVFEAMDIKDSQPCYILNQSAPDSYIQGLTTYLSNVNIIPTEDLELSEALLCV